MRFRVALFALAVAAAGCAPAATVVNVSVTDDGFEPKVVTVPQGRKATLVITRKVEATCATEAVFVENGQRYDLPLGQAVSIPIATDSVRTLHYACAMDMYHGQVDVK